MGRSISEILRERLNAARAAEGLAPLPPPPPPLKLPTSAAVNEATGWLIAMAAAYHDPWGSLSTHAQRTDAKRFQAALRKLLEARIELGEVVERMHRDEYLVRSTGRWLMRYGAREGATKRFTEMWKEYSGRELSEDELGRIATGISAAEGSGSAQDSRLARLLSALLGLSTRAIYKIQQANEANMAAMPSWLGHRHPLRDDAAKRAVLRLVIADLFGFDDTKSAAVIELLGLTPPPDDDPEE